MTAVLALCARVRGGGGRGFVKTTFQRSQAGGGVDGWLNYLMGLNLFS